MYYVFCIMYEVLCITYSVVFAMCLVLCAMHYVICIMYYVHYNLYYVLCCAMHFARGSQEPGGSHGSEVSHIYIIHNTQYIWHSI